ncbi:MAG: RNA methyltransferase [Acutalibacteraceae bacterium]|nr:RNA methyltransferase [Acutalibacteraceae bacterium]
MNKVIEITDFLAPELDVYARLTEGQVLNREFPEKGMFIAESPKVIERALDAGYEPVSCLMEKRHIEGEGKQILQRIKDVPVFCAEFDVLTQLTGFKLTRGMLCAMKRKALPDVRELCENKRRIVILDKVMNPTNVGAIIRSAAALGMDAVLLTPGCSDPLYRRAARVSMGTVFQIDWTFLREDSLDEIKALGFKTVAMALKDNSLSINDPGLTAEKKLAIIMGTEGDGLSDKTISDCDFTVKIPMYHGVDSLNVAAASAVAFYQLGNIGNDICQKQGRTRTDLQNPVRNG